MAKINNYPLIPEVREEDLLLISDRSELNAPTRSVTVESLSGFLSTYIDSASQSDLNELEASLTALQALVGTNTSSTQTNSSNIAQNTSDIAQNTSDISQNTSDTAQNTNDVAQNTSDIAAVSPIVSQNTSDITAAADSALAGHSGYSHSGAFADKPLDNNFVWQAGAGVSYSQADVDASLWKVFSLSEAVHLAVDNPYWSTPTPSGTTGIGLFQGANLPNNVSKLFEFDFDYDTNYPSSSGTGFEGTTGRIRLNDAVYGDQLRVRFDFNVIPQIANTTVEPALWYSNRNDSDDITFTFPLTAQPIFYGQGTVGRSFLNRVDISAWITSNEDVNALTLPAIKSDNPVIIQPLGLLVTLIR